VPRRLLIAAAAAAGALILVVVAQLPAPAQVAPAPPFPAPPPPRPAPPAALTPIPGPASEPRGVPWCGRLVAGVPLAAASSYFLTIEMPTGLSPNPAWRRYGTARLIAMLRRVARADRAAHPRGPRLAIGDLSLPRGGPFGPRYGGLGHRSHQNGLDVDVVYPRRDGLETPPPARPAEVDRVRVQQLVDRFVAAGAERVFVGFGMGLRGPRGVVTAIPYHQDHMHVRIPALNGATAPARCPWQPR
jgi:hypothetical protein